jgi:uncharacterized protein (DUF3820 family)
LYNNNKQIEIMTLKFGKFKGTKLQDTPQWYQDWLSKQDWFNKPKTQIPLHQQLNGWDGYSKRGEAIYDAIFEQEKEQSLKEMCNEGICSCCEDSIYYGI